MTNEVPLSILLVDDETEVTELLSYSLRKEPYIIKTASSAREALDLFAKEPFDILVTDIKMPRMDGLELIARLRSKKPELLVIVISAHGDVDIAVRAMKGGAIDFLQKPINHKVLKMSIELAAEKWALLHELELSNQALIKEVAQRKKIQVDLEEEKELLAVTLRSIGDGVIATDVQGRVVLMNKVAENMTGWKKNEAAGLFIEKVFNLIDEKLGEPCTSPVKMVTGPLTNVNHVHHAVLVARDGGHKVIANSTAPIKDSESVLVGIVCVFKDITNERRMEKELLKVQKLKAVGVLAGGIAHDFNNVLSGILGNLELANHQLGDRDSKVSALLSNAGKATRRAAKLTQQLLTFSKGGDPVREVTSLPQLIKDSAEFVLQGSQISCEYDFADKLWPVDVDAGQISQVIQNIIINADHAMPDGGRISITGINVNQVTEPILSMHKGDFVCITIKDTGIGIPQEIIDKIFDPYFSTKHHGSGLGLSICHSIINKHEGYLTVHSTSGKGTIFTMYLPAIPAAVIKNEGKTAGISAVEPARILVMDDEEILRNVAASILDTMGHEVVLAENGEEALKKCRELLEFGTPIDLVIMDLTIPGGMGGREAVGKLLEMDPKAKVIVSSGYSNDPVMANYKEYGFVASIAKPFDMQDLCNLVTEMLQQ
jgi:PAS domain S-box-containing protein